MRVAKKLQTRDTFSTSLSSAQNVVDNIRNPSVPGSPSNPGSGGSGYIPVSTGFFISGGLGGYPYIVLPYTFELGLKAEYSLSMEGDGSMLETADISVTVELTSRRDDITHSFNDIVTFNRTFHNYAWLPISDDTSFDTIQLNVDLSEFYSKDVFVDAICSIQVESEDFDIGLRSISSYLHPLSGGFETVGSDPANFLAFGGLPG